MSVLGSCPNGEIVVKYRGLISLRKPDLQRGLCYILIRMKNVMCDNVCKKIGTRQLSVVICLAL
jgi:hypothetical protein